MVELKGGDEEENDPTFIFRILNDERGRWNDDETSRHWRLFRLIRKTNSIKIILINFWNNSTVHVESPNKEKYINTCTFCT